ncbi:hypothetical protein D3C81_1764200 [compost metagenome]
MSAPYEALLHQHQLLFWKINRNLLSLNERLLHFLIDGEYTEFRLHLVLVAAAEIRADLHRSGQCVTGCTRLRHSSKQLQIVRADGPE